MEVGIRVRSPTPPTSITAKPCPAASRVPAGRRSSATPATANAAPARRRPRRRWQMAIARASAASSGWGIWGRSRRAWSHALHLRASGPPEPGQGLLDLGRGVLRHRHPGLRQGQQDDPRAWPTLMAVVVLRPKKRRPPPTRPDGARRSAGRGHGRGAAGDGHGLIRGRLHHAVGQHPVGPFPPGSWRTKRHRWWRCRGRCPGRRRLRRHQHRRRPPGSGASGRPSIRHSVAPPAITRLARAVSSSSRD